MARVERNMPNVEDCSKQPRQLAEVDSEGDDFLFSEEIRKTMLFR